MAFTLRGAAGQCFFSDRSNKYQKQSNDATLLSAPEEVMTATFRIQEFIPNIPHGKGDYPVTFFGPFGFVGNKALSNVAAIRQ